jgi:hypothetical protein
MLQLVMKTATEPAAGYDVDRIKTTSIISARKQRELGEDFGKWDRSSKFSADLPSQLRPLSSRAGVDLDEARGLHIFAEKDEQGQVVINIKNERAAAAVCTESHIWTRHYADELVCAEESLPESGFDEMIAHTQAGQSWRYPIDNEQGKITLTNF